ncbi:cyclin-dependent protein kinase inhibitor SMR6 [Diospyros lotus]|uniref:cyclin-dependent protein kinase inhibitor SMR6 n=1 Tax=Diospyros lotus TaxID=55363 RepID=UPI00224E1EC6|nr:cyclin-dependent protein kinase inhibitor SMR6 [Diospyros lotus]
MGCSKKHHQSEEGKKRAVAGIAFCAPLRSIATEPKERVLEADGGETTPTARESRIPEGFPCPPAPRKRRPSSCHRNSSRQFFTPPDLESVFRLHVEKAI